MRAIKHCSQFSQSIVFFAGREQQSFKKIESRLSSLKGKKACKEKNLNRYIFSLSFLHSLMYISLQLL